MGRIEQPGLEQTGRDESVPFNFDNKNEQKPTGGGGEGKDGSDKEEIEGAMGANPEELGEMTHEAAGARREVDDLAQRAGDDFEREVVNNPSLIKGIAGKVADKVADNKLFTVSAIMAIATIVISGEINNAMLQADVFINSFPSYSAPEGGLIKGMEAYPGIMDFYSRIDGVMGFYDKVQDLKNIRVATVIAGALAAVGGVAQKMGVGVNINKTK